EVWQRFRLINNGSITGRYSLQVFKVPTGVVFRLLPNRSGDNVHVIYKSVIGLRLGDASF
ncbi:hypothetical protein, partial [Streptomyces hilarionis]|uniref:hypothetical protein n=1 Tax=Streptomyces hilarionis TaxID=2839954 RepID=UPI00211A53AE